MTLLVSALAIFASQTVWSQNTPKAAEPSEPAKQGEEAKGEGKEEGTAEKPAITPKPADAKIAIHDVLAIIVNEDGANLNGYYRVAPNGVIGFKYAGNIPVEGLTAAELAAQLKKILEADFLKKATVTVEVNAPMVDKGGVLPPVPAQNLGTIWVMGQVQNKGQMQIPPDGQLTVSTALVKAGIPQFAKISRTKLVRMEGGKSKEIIVNVYEIIYRGKRELDVPVQKDDWIIVPQGMFPDPS
jgi:protein involved in polysaccharide export with SLBB domain